MRLWNAIAGVCAGLCLMGGLAAGALAGGQQQPLSVRVANGAMDLYPPRNLSLPIPGSGRPEWIGEQADLLAGVEAVWRNSVERRAFSYIEDSVDPVIGPDGLPPPLRKGESRLADDEVGRQLLLLYGVTLKKRYFDAATSLYDALQHQPRNPSGGFSWSQNDPDVMTLDDFAAEPFYAEYARTFHHPEAFAEIAKQFVLMQDHAHDPKTGLLSYRWDESRKASWADKQTGRDGGATTYGIGSYLAALVDTIPWFPQDQPGRKQLIAILNRDAAVLVRYQSAKTGLWNQVLDGTGIAAAKKQIDAPGSCLLVYALAKGIRRGYLPQRYDGVAERAYSALVKRYVATDSDGSVIFTGTDARDQMQGAEEPLAAGAFILASTEIENLQNAKIGRGDTVMLDAWFNSQKRMDPTGHEIYFHYKWNDQSNPGYSLWGHFFRNFGARTATLYAEPTAQNLHDAQVYIIASPDNLEKNPKAHIANAKDAEEIAKWVKAGGVLALMENDTSFADLHHFNAVSEKFGIHFNSVLRMHVVGTDWAMGRFYLDGNGPIFHQPHTAYVKDVCTISVKPPAVPAYTHQGDIFMAVAKYGKGTVYAMVDPWFYNEYTNGLKLPAEYDNYAAGVELARWLLEQVPKNQGTGNRE